MTWSETPQQLQAEVVRVQPELATHPSDHMLPSRAILTCPSDLQPSLDLKSSLVVPDLEIAPGPRGDASSLTNQEIGYCSVPFSAVRDEGQLLESLSNSEDGELRSSEGSSSTITPELNEKDSFVRAPCDVAEWTAAENDNLPTAEIAIKSSPHVTRENTSGEVDGWTTRLQYHENITPTSIPHCLEQRHHTGS